MEAAVVKYMGHEDASVRIVTGDNYSAEWVQAAFKERDVEYKRSELTKSALYLEALPLFMRGVISIPNSPKLIRELRLLERRASRTGRDVVDHDRNGSDDHANALAGMLRGLAAPPYMYDATMSWIGGDENDANEAWRQSQYYQHVTRGW